MDASNHNGRFVIAIAVAPEAIGTLTPLIAPIPPDFPAPLLVTWDGGAIAAKDVAQSLGSGISLPVQIPESNTLLEAGTVYIVSTDRDFSIEDGRFHIHENDRTNHSAIDRLFGTIVEDVGDSTIGVVLAGTGDAAGSGARSIKYAGGTVIVQTPEADHSPVFPVSLSPSIVDITARLDRLGQVVIDLVSGIADVPPMDQDTLLRSFLDDIREEHGIDFSTYKQPTISRRLRSRMIATGHQRFSDYARFVHHHPEERERLISSLLIKVTEFFRDPELFTALQESVLPQILREAHQRDAEVRLWSAGCATGEEAYSLAMVVAEVQEAEQLPVKVRIFATDLDKDAVSFARRGIYPERAMDSVPVDFAYKYFDRQENHFEVRKSIRSTIVFGEHDLAQRAPFPRIDLILCRNVLIYFTPTLQRRCLQMFAFSLKSEGYLALGKSETVNPMAEYFATDHSRLKLYRRAGARMVIPPPRTTSAMPTISSVPTSHTIPGGDMNSSRKPDVRHRFRMSEERVLQALQYGIVVINQNYDILTINAEARRLLGIHTPAVGQDLVHLINQYDPLVLRRAIDQAASTGKASSAQLGSRSDNRDDQRILEVVCSHIDQGSNEEDRLTLVSVFDTSDRERLRHRLEGTEERVRFLAEANQQVLESNQQLTVLVSRLRAENEELLVAAEEVQAATEEVETLNEELQATNEELETLNEELQATVEELNTTNEDLQSRTFDLQALASENNTSHIQLRNMMDAFDDPICLVNDKGIVELSNSAWLQEFGRQQMDGAFYNEAGDPIPEDLTPIARLARGESFTGRVSVRDGQTENWYEARGSNISDDQGRTIGFLVMRSAGNSANASQS